VIRMSRSSVAAVISAPASLTDTNSTDLLHQVELTTFEKESGHFYLASTDEMTVIAFFRSPAAKSDFI
jgi:hypothetical protein